MYGPRQGAKGPPTGLERTAHARVQKTHPQDSNVWPTPWCPAPSQVTKGGLERMAHAMVRKAHPPLHCPCASRPPPLAHRRARDEASSSRAAVPVHEEEFKEDGLVQVHEEVFRGTRKSSSARGRVQVQHDEELRCSTRK